MPPTEHDYYAALLARYLRNDCTADETAQLDRWYAAMNQKLPEPALSNDAVAALAAASWGVVLARIQPEPGAANSVAEDVAVRPLKGRRTWVGRNQWAVAASVAVLLLAGLGVWQVGWFGPKTSLITAMNRSKVIEKINLDDGSVVWLSPKSTVRYQRPLAADRRMLTLDGQAFFVVTKDAKRPFTVKTNSLTVKVLGTSFTVRAFAGQATAEVSVRTGRVSVTRPNQKAELVLLPNERVMVGGTDKNKLVKTVVVAPEVINPAVVTNRFVFADTPVSEVFALLERAYNVRIDFDKQTLATCSFTAKLTDQPLFTKLDIICASIGATYRIEGATIVVKSAGCE